MFESRQNSTLCLSQTSSRSKLSWRSKIRNQIFGTTSPMLISCKLKHNHNSSWLAERWFRPFSWSNCSGKCLSGRKTRRQAKNFFSWLWNLCQLEGNRVNRLSRNLSDHVLNISAAILNYRRLAEVLRKRNIFRPLDFDLAKLGGRSYKQRSRKLDGTKAAIWLT